MKVPDYEIKTAVISAASSGDNTIVAAVSGRKIRVLGLFFTVAGDVDVRFESGAGGTALTGVMEFAAAGNGIALPLSGNEYVYYFETAAGALLNMELSAAVQVSGALTYCEV